jgi:tetratricopeptide (TPR) repeat protein
MRKAVRLYSEARDISGMGYALTNLATSLRESGYPEHAIDPLTRASKIHRISGANRAEASTISQLGIVYGQIGRYAESLRLLGDALQLAKAMDDTLLLGITAMNRASVYRAMGRDDGAEEDYGRALACFRSVDDVPHQAVALENLADLYRNSGEIAKINSVANELANLEARYPALRGVVAARWERKS